jgi:glucuronate isomerase
MIDKEWELNPARFFSSEPSQRKIAFEIYQNIKNLPILSPHGHVNIEMFTDTESTLGDPVELFVKSDHYIFRMLHSQGISLESLGIISNDNPLPQVKNRQVWQIFADNYYLFWGTPSRAWLDYVLNIVFQVKKRLSGETAQGIYDELCEKITSAEYHPRKLFEKFNIELLSTTDLPTDTLDNHLAIRKSSWKANIIPTFRPDSLLNLTNPSWRKEIQKLENVTGSEIKTFSSFIQALRERRDFFQKAGAVATDHGVLVPVSEKLSTHQLETIFKNALNQQITTNEAEHFSAHMLFEMAKMSVEDGLIMQIHPGSFRNHNTQIFDKFGPDKGFDIPIAVEFTRGLRTILESFGNHPSFSCILFTLDESTYSRELAPLAGVYSSIKLGPPWWFHDSPNGIQRYFDQVIETAGFWNTTGFIDDTRSFPSIPARHDLWRRICANWLANMVVQHRLEQEDSLIVAEALAYKLSKMAYKI